MKSEITGTQFNILESMVHGVMVTDLKGHIIYCNPSNVKIFGYSKTEAEGMSIRTLYDENDDKIPFRDLYDEIENEAPLQLNWHGIRKDNSRVWLDIRANIVKSDDGEPDGCVISLHIIEDVKRTKTQLEKNRAFAEAILESSVDAILSVGENGDIIRLNDAATDLFGYNKEELIGKKVDMLIPPSFDDYAKMYMNKIKKKNGQKISEKGMEINAMKKDGSEFPVELSLAEVTWDGRKIYTAIVKDMTKRRDLERRIIEIGNEERRRIGRDLHDGLGQMLTGIRLLSENLASKLRDKNVPEADGIEDIAEMVREADEYARDLSHGMVVTELENKGFIHAIENLCDRTEKTTGISCTFSKEEQVDINDFDIALHLFRIIQEAVNNAVKHSEASKIEVEITSNPHLKLTVSDDGDDFEVADETFPGTGIQIMNYRAKVLGGHFEITRTDDDRTQVKCDFPNLEQKA